MVSVGKVSGSDGAHGSADFGGRHPTLKDIAALAGLDVSTVSRALNPKQSRRVNPATAARVRAIALEHGYQTDPLAAGLRRGRTFSVGILVADIANSYLAPVLRGLQDGLDEHGLTAVIAETRDESERRDRALRLLAGRRVDALIVASARKGDEEAISTHASRFPVVLCLRGMPGLALPSVTADDHLGGALAAGYLAQLGHRTLAEVRGPADIHAFTARDEGFRSKAEEFGCEVDSRWEATAPTQEEGRRLTDLMIASSRPMPTAIFAQTDAMAIGAITALRASGLTCPGDVSVIGFNDSPLTEFLDPPLTTIRVAGYELGRRAAQLALESIAGEAAEPEHILLPPELIVRKSTRHVGRAGT